jgi:hypothetical protein
MTTTQTDPYPDLPIPAGAVEAEWQDPGTPKAFRYFEGKHWTVFREHSRDIEVYVAGIQELDGSVKREIVVHETHADEPLTPGEALQLARALSGAAAALGRIVVGPARRPIGLEHDGR